MISNIVSLKMKTLWRERRIFWVCFFYTSFWFCNSNRWAITGAVCLPPPVPVAGCLGDCHGVMCCWGVVACRKWGLCFSLNDMLAGDYIFWNVLLKKTRQTSGLQTVIHSTFADMISNPSSLPLKSQFFTRAKAQTLSLKYRQKPHWHTWAHSCTRLHTYPI